jgi:hypothetical protein
MEMLHIKPSFTINDLVLNCLNRDEIITNIYCNSDFGEDACYSILLSLDASDRFCTSGIVFKIGSVIH